MCLKKQLLWTLLLKLFLDSLQQARVLCLPIFWAKINYIVQKKKKPVWWECKQVYLQRWVNKMNLFLVLLHRWLFLKKYLWLVGAESRREILTFNQELLNHLLQQSMGFHYCSVDGTLFVVRKFSSSCLKLIWIKEQLLTNNMRVCICMYTYTQRYIKSLFRTKNPCSSSWTTSISPLVQTC